ncbi:MAG: hypothetical protein L3J39_08455 [Verrucomicrobiales bacterium]|nr:hypothetical protein [Verrucomicrobiales bacterium]
MKKKPNKTQQSNPLLAPSQNLNETFNPQLEHESSLPVAGCLCSTFAMKNIGNARTFVLLVASVAVGAVIVVLARGFISPMSIRYSLIFGVIHPPELVWGFVFASPLLATTIYLIPKTHHYTLLISVAVAGLVAICLSYLLTQEFSPSGKMILFSTQRLSGLIPFLIPPILLILLNRFRQGASEGEQNVEPNT